MSGRLEGERFAEMDKWVATSAGPDGDAGPWGDDLFLYARQMRAEVERLKAVLELSTSTMRGAAACPRCSTCRGAAVVVLEEIAALGKATP